MDELITINPANEQFPINARELYEKIDLHPAHWARWAKQNIEENPFAIQGRDYVLLTIRVSGEVSRVRGNFANDYELSIDFAKCLCMMAKTEKGEQIRRYFIEAEKRFKQLIQTDSPEAIQGIKERRLLAALERSNLVIEKYQEAIEHNIQMFDFVSGFMKRLCDSFESLESTITQAFAQTSESASKEPSAASHQYPAQRKPKAVFSKVTLLGTPLKLEIIKRRFLNNETIIELEWLLKSQGLFISKSSINRYFHEVIQDFQLQDENNLQIIEREGPVTRHITVKDGQITVQVTQIG